MIFSSYIISIQMYFSDLSLPRAHGELNIEPDAWGGRFSAQVRVKWKAISMIRGASTKFSFLKNICPRHVTKLSEEQGGELLRALGPECIEIPAKFKYEIQKLDGEIHILAHRIEEEMRFSRDHPANREIDLDRLKGEFIAKMKDFIWAVRKLDKHTGILELPSSK
ncbi:hypothetical protein [Candidatus Methanodesulfokora washburnensis]|uniref:hypothetical protein n=1 Tax=Candidatus Methanodesulfokora washburnensis TaxID=2478471 RepID=UPI00192A1F77|nr:hypothetical protein [Candidatus Methanodesulfokores washburnensis]